LHNLDAELALLASAELDGERLHVRVGARRGGLLRLVTAARGEREPNRERGAPCRQAVAHCALPTSNSRIAARVSSADPRTTGRWIAFSSDVAASIAARRASSALRCNPTWAIRLDSNAPRFAAPAASCRSSEAAVSAASRSACVAFCSASRADSYCAKPTS